MHKVIHSNFQIDLSNTSISIVEENAWFSDRFFSKYSFPFEIIITEFENQFFSYFLDHNIKTQEKIFTVVYVRDNIMEEAFLEISNQTNNKLKLKVRYGLDELPNYNKKLSDLPLEQIEITDMLMHFESIISQTYPAVNYNFPQIYTNKYEDDKDILKHFKGIINNYDGTFPINEIISTPISDPDHDQDGVYNRGFVKPLISFLYLLKIGFLDAGYTLQGEILNDFTIQKIWLFCSKNNFESDFNIHHLVNVSNYATLSFYAPQIPPNSISANYASYSSNYPIPAGKYKVSGQIKKFNGYEYLSTSSIYASTNPYNGNNIIFGYLNYKLPQNGNIEVLEVLEDLEVDFELTIPNDGISYFLYFDATFPILTSENFDVFDINIEQTSFLIDNNKDIDLRNDVPDMTFGKYLTICKNWFNLDVKPKDEIITVDFIKNKINYQDSVSLKAVEIKKVKKKFQKKQSFLLEYSDVENLDSQSVYHDFDGVQSSEFTKADNTNVIEIEALPLAIKADTVTTALSSENKDNKLYAVLYDGLQDPLNTGTLLNTTIIDLTPLNITTIHNKYYKNWLDFRIDSNAYYWSFYMFAEQSRNIDIRKKIFAYGLFHIIKNIKRTQIQPSLYKIDIETNTLK